MTGVTSMRQMMMPRLWIEGHLAQPANLAQPGEDLWKKMWDYGWGLLFVVVLTLLSVFGPPTASSKQSPDEPMASQPVLHGVK
jgi:hypothetical protein